MKFFMLFSDQLTFYSWRRVRRRGAKIFCLCIRLIQNSLLESSFTLGSHCALPLMGERSEKSCYSTIIATLTALQFYILLVEYFLLVLEVLAFDTCDYHFPNMDFVDAISNILRIKLSMSFDIYLIIFVSKGNFLRVSSYCQFENPIKLVREVVGVFLHINAIMYRIQQCHTQKQDIYKHHLTSNAQC